MNKKSFEILSTDRVVAVWNDGELTIVNDALLPLYLKRISKCWNVALKPYYRQLWINGLLKKALRLAEKDDIPTVVCVNFEPASTFTGDNEGYEAVVTEL